VVERKILISYRESNSGRPARSLINILTELSLFLMTHGGVESKLHDFLTSALVGGLASFTLHLFYPLVHPVPIG